MSHLRRLSKYFARLVVPLWVREFRAERIRIRVRQATEQVLAVSQGRVIGGPFAGMEYVDEAHSSQLGPKLLGSYELEIAPVIEGVLNSDITSVVDVGAAEGYYAVGLLRRNPACQVLAFEGSATAATAMRSLAMLNQVVDRLTIHGYCDHDELRRVLDPGPA